MPKPKPKYCLRGHPRTPDNINKRGGCKICAIAAVYAWRARQPVPIPQYQHLVGPIMDRLIVALAKHPEGLSCKQLAAAIGYRTRVPTIRVLLSHHRRHGSVITRYIPGKGIQLVMVNV